MDDASLSGDNNTAFGYNAMSGTTTGYSSTAVGSDALRDSDTGHSNVAVGLGALRGLPDGSHNTALGTLSMSGADGSRNIAIGTKAMQFAGSDGVNLANDNVTIGYQAALGVNGTTRMNDSVIIGSEAATAATSPDSSVIIGYRSGYAITGGDNNILLGYQAGDNLTTGDDNIIIGHDIDASAAGANNELNIGGTIYGDLSNDYVGIANAFPDVELDVTGDIEYTGTISDMSDRRLKEEITNLPANQIEKILGLQGVSFKMKDDEDATLEYGFIAQDVQEIYPSLVYERSEGYLSMTYMGLIAPMVEAMKEQQAIIDRQQAQIEALSARLDALEGQ